MTETAWTYDKWGRLVEKNTGAQPVRYSYNKLGQTVAVDYGPASGGMLKY